MLRVFAWKSFYFAWYAAEKPGKSPEQWQWVCMEDCNNMDKTACREQYNKREQRQNK